MGNEKNNINAEKLLVLLDITQIAQQNNFLYRHHSEILYRNVYCANGEKSGYIAVPSHIWMEFCQQYMKDIERYAWRKITNDQKENSVANVYLPAWNSRNIQ